MNTHDSDKALLILHEMRELRANGDREIAHTIADDLLCDALLEAADGNITPDLAKDMIAAWMEIPKWYA